MRKELEELKELCEAFKKGRADYGGAPDIYNSDEKVYRILFWLDDRITALETIMCNSVKELNNGMETNRNSAEGWE